MRSASTTTSSRSAATPSYHPDRRPRQGGRLRALARQVFDHLTIAALAQVARPVGAPQGRAGARPRRRPLTPIQHWFFACRFPDPHHFNQAVLLAVAPEVVPPLLAEGARPARGPPPTRCGGASSWAHPGEGRAAGSAASSSEEPLRDRGPRRVAGRRAGARPARGGGGGPRAGCASTPARCSAWSCSASGPASPAAYCGSSTTSVVDGVSWRHPARRSGDRLFTNCTRGETVRLPPKTTSFKTWSAEPSPRPRDAVARPAARRLAAQAEQAYWRSAVGPALPVDEPAGPNLKASAAEVHVELSAAETAAPARCPRTPIARRSTTCC